MIKGVNKRILEVSFPESKYFEKAVVFLRADKLPDSAGIEAEMKIPELERRISDPAYFYGCHGSNCSGSKKRTECIIGLLFRLSAIICAAAVVMICICQ